MNSEQECIAFSQRLNAAMSAHGHQERDRAALLTKWTGIGREGVRKWLSGMSIPRKPRIIELSRHLSCRAEWLEYGDGPMNQAGHPNPKVDALLKLVEERLCAAEDEELAEMEIALRRILR